MKNMTTIDVDRVRLDYMNYFIDKNKSKVDYYQCPACGDIYKLEESKVNYGITHCWVCHQPYLQKVHKMSNYKFVRDACYRVRS